MMDSINEIFEKHHLNSGSITSSMSGFTNNVYITEEHVLKQYNEKTGFEKELWFYQNTNFPFAPKLIAHDDSDAPYIIIEKIYGNPLYRVWHTFDDRKRETIVSKIADSVKEIQSIKPNGYLKAFHIQSAWGNRLVNNITSSAQSLRNSTVITYVLYNSIIEFIRNYAYALNDVSFAITYCDLHFDNIFINDHNDICLIDFETLGYTPMDYFLDIWLRMAKYPHLYANNQDETHVLSKDYAHLAEWLKIYYPESFTLAHSKERLGLYALEYDLCQLKSYPQEQSLIKRILEDIKV